MLLKRAFVLMAFSVLMAAMVGCGGGVEEGAATGTDEPAPVLSPEEEATEEAYVEQVEQQ